MARDDPDVSEVEPSKFAALLDDSRFSDLILKCEGEEFHVHKCIVCLESPVFTAACGGDFQESKDNSIEVFVANKFTLAQMIQYLYTDDYDCKPTLPSARREAVELNTRINPDNDRNAVPSSGSIENSHLNGSRADKTISDETRSSKTLLMHAQVYIAADYYQMPDLCDLALMKFRAPLCSLNIGAFIEVIELVYDFKSESAAKRLRSALCYIAVKYAELLLFQPEFLDKVVHFPEFMRDFLPRLYKAPERPTNHTNPAARDQKRARYP